MGKLDQKVAIVTGAGGGIGRAIALELAKAGASVAVCDINQSDVEKVAGEISALGRRSLALRVDVSNAGQVRKMAEQTAKEFKKIDILVNNAGVVHRALIVDFAEADWDRVMSVNLKGIMLCIQAVSPYMLKQKYGKIVNLASSAGIHIASQLAAYGVSKAGVIHLTRIAASELGPYGINVNSISPGTIDTDIYKRIRTPEQVAEFEENSKKNAFLGRLGKTQDIANLALFLVSDDSSFITAENVVIDGGRA